MESLLRVPIGSSRWGALPKYLVVMESLVVDRINKIGYAFNMYRISCIKYTHILFRMEFVLVM